MAKVDFYYDIVSPYSWIAFEEIQKLRNALQLEINWLPFLLGGIMKATGNSAPFFLPARAPYLLKDIQRQARFHNLPMNIPADFPSNTLLTQRFLTVVKSKAPQYLEKISHSLWKRLYGEGLSVSTADEILACVTSSETSPKMILGWLEMAHSQEAKNALKSTTEEALQRGAFGAPTFYIQKNQHSSWEMFFGSDRMHLVKQYLKET